MPEEMLASTDLTADILEDELCILYLVEKQRP